MILKIDQSMDEIKKKEKTIHFISVGDQTRVSFSFSLDGPSGLTNMRCSATSEGNKSERQPSRYTTTNCPHHATHDSPHNPALNPIDLLHTNTQQSPHPNEARRGDGNGGEPPLPPAARRQSFNIIHHHFHHAPAAAWRPGQEQRQHKQQHQRPPPATVDQRRGRVWLSGAVDRFGSEVRWVLLECLGRSMIGRPTRRVRHSSTHRSTHRPHRITHTQQRAGGGRHGMETVGSGINSSTSSNSAAFVPRPLWWVAGCFFVVGGEQRVSSDVTGVIRPNPPTHTTQPFPLPPPTEP